MARPSRINFIYKHSFAVLPKRNCTRVTSVHLYSEASENLSGSFLQTFGKIATYGLKALFKHHLSLPKFWPFGNLAHSFYEASYQKVVEIHQTISNCNGFLKKKKKNQPEKRSPNSSLYTSLPRYKTTRFSVSYCSFGCCSWSCSVNPSFLFFFFSLSFSGGISDKGIIRILWLINPSSFFY